MNRFPKSRARVALIIFLAVGGFLLAFEHSAHILTSNGILFAFLAACIGIHLFMHGGHSSHADPEHGEPEDSVAESKNVEEK